MNADELRGRHVAAFLRRCGVAAERLKALDALRQLYEALLDANRAANLTRITNEADYWNLHVADSLSVGLVVPELLRDPLAAVDVGCGAGFPMLPLAWANPNLRITGIESGHKKAAFVRRQIGALDLGGASVVAGRAREVARLPAHAGRYDVVLARAVGPAAKLIRECRGLLRPTGGARMVFYKTPAGIEAERGLAAREAAKFRLALYESQVIALPQARGTRQFLIVAAAGIR
jgi:16S rRNA (guanine527-N7)-methyltransferase